MPLKISCLIGSCGDEIGYVERCAGIWCTRGALVDGMQRIECRMWSRIEHIKLARWQYSVPARGRMKLSICNRALIVWKNTYHLAQGVAPTLPSSFTRAYFKASTAVVLFPPRDLTRKQVRHINRFLIACAMFPAEETTPAFVL